MINRERLQSLNTADFWEEVSRLKCHSLEEFINYTAFLDSEDPEIMHFVKSLGECWVAPSETDTKISEIEKSAPPKPKKGILLKHRTFYGQPYAVVYIEDYSTSYISVPEKLVTMIKEEN
jgi:hypothetical protein